MPRESRYPRDVDFASPLFAQQGDGKIPPMFTGYARVSTEDQNLDLQRNALTAAGYEVIYEDCVSGAVNGSGRKGFSEALAR